jgi:hypothetical protein
MTGAANYAQELPHFENGGLVKDAFLLRRMCVIPAPKSAYQIFPKIVKIVGFFTIMFFWMSAP